MKGKWNIFYILDLFLCELIVEFLFFGVWKSKLHTKWQWIGQYFGSIENKKGFLDIEFNWCAKQIQNIFVPHRNTPTYLCESSVRWRRRKYFIFEQRRIKENGLNLNRFIFSFDQIRIFGVVEVNSLVVRTESFGPEIVLHNGHSTSSDILLRRRRRRTTELIGVLHLICAYFFLSLPCLQSECM